jgi:hypothetical protein
MSSSSGLLFNQSSPQLPWIGGNKDYEEINYGCKFKVTLFVMFPL